MFSIFNITNKPIGNTNTNYEPIECNDDEIKLDEIDDKNQHVTIWILEQYKQDL